MSTARLRHPRAEALVVAQPSKPASEERLADLSTLAALPIETGLVSNLSGELHALFDPISEDVLPIYFGPLLGRLYLEGL